VAHVSEGPSNKSMKLTTPEALRGSRSTQSVVVHSGVGAYAPCWTDLMVGRGHDRWTVVVLAACLCMSCTTDDLGGEYSGDRFLTVIALPVPGTTATRPPDITCAGSLTVQSHTGDDISGTYVRLGCSGLLNPTLDARGTFTGVALADGTASLSFNPAPLPVPDAVTSSGGCADSASAAGPFVGTLTSTSVALSSEFHVFCAGLPMPAPPAFDVEYRIEASM
jgi:hypothetical protein